ncbi:hypothetical protein EUX98_g3262 [Antrodiella citrinella]|uniref:Uncharacterized protein n=1 Tax=Antrodiella citrinella TaxID=2447956 RepID=A0A4S4MX17_9APHY|nr:hypothetical protein EUX98_g3262 [Antrodiella citrinella]
MALARAGSLILRQQASRPFLQSRFASSNAHDDDHHDAHHGDSSHGQELSFPKEDFSSRVWGKTAIAALAFVAFYKFAPSPGEENYITRLLTQSQETAEYWRKVNLQHLFLSATERSDNLVIADAQRPPVHRYRYPQ